MLDATALKAQIDVLVNAANDLAALKAAPTVSTYGDTLAAYNTLVEQFDLLTAATQTFSNEAQSTVRLT